VPSLTHKFPRTLEAALDEFKREARRVIDFDAANEEDDTRRMQELNMDVKSDVFTNLTMDRANKVTQRLRMFRTLRDEVLHHPNLKGILRSCKRKKDLPAWYRPSVHDVALSKQPTRMV